MSYPYPQDRHRDRKEKGEQPYKDARETFTENEAEIRDEAGRDLDQERQLTEEDRKALIEQDAKERFADIGDERDDDN